MSTHRHLLTAGLIALLASGCFSPTKRVDVRTAMEQQVVHVALERAVRQLDFSQSPLPGTYRVQVTAPFDADAGLIRSALEKRLHAEGLQVTRDESASVPIVEAKVAYAGSELEGTLIGVPIVVPGLPVAFGDLSFYKSSTQTGRARMSIAYWDANGNLQGHGPNSEGTAYFKNFSILTFFGDFIWTDMKDFQSPGQEKKDDPKPEETGEVAAGTS